MVRIRQAGSERGGASTAVLVVLVVFVVAAAVAAFLWTRYTRSPQYAAHKTLQAVSSRDYGAFAQWVDVDAVARAAVREEAANRGIQLPPQAEEAAVASARAQLADRVRQGVPGVPGNVPLVALVFGAPARVSANDGTQARVTVDAQGRSIEFVMRRDGDRWRVAEVPGGARLLGAPASALPSPRALAGTVACRRGA
jgi:hypothetical protein